MLQLHNLTFKASCLFPTHLKTFEATIAFQLFHKASSPPEHIQFLTSICYFSTSKSRTFHSQPSFSRHFWLGGSGKKVQYMFADTTKWNSSLNHQNCFCVTTIGPIAQMHALTMVDAYEQNLIKHLTYIDNFHHHFSP